jgi:hypothetical protein
MQAVGGRAARNCRPAACGQLSACSLRASDRLRNRNGRSRMRRRARKSSRSSARSKSSSYSARSRITAVGFPSRYTNSCFREAITDSRSARRHVKAAVAPRNRDRWPRRHETEMKRTCGNPHPFVSCPSCFRGSNVGFWVSVGSTRRWTGKQGGFRCQLDLTNGGNVATLAAAKRH